MIANSKFILILTFGFAVGFSGCALFIKKEPVKAPPPQKPAHSQQKSQPKSTPVDAQAQQKFYDRGLKYYTEENYAEAKKSWQQAIQLGPNTALADKSREYLKKTEQVLKTLEEMEKR